MANKVDITELQEALKVDFEFKQKPSGVKADILKKKKKKK